MKLLSLAEFFDGVAVAGFDMFPEDRRVLQETSQGVVSAVSVGQQAWTGTMNLRIEPHAEANVLRARLAQLQQGDVFFTFDVLDQPVETGGTGSITTIAADRREVRLSGVSPKAGEYLELRTRGIRSLHLVCEVGGGAATIVPPAPLSIEVGGYASTRRPQANAVLAPAASGGEMQPLFTSGITIPFRTVLLDFDP